MSGGRFVNFTLPPTGTVIEVRINLGLWLFGIVGDHDQHGMEVALCGQRGFVHTANPAVQWRPPQGPAPWWVVLRFTTQPSSVDDVRGQFRKLALAEHPDRGGDEKRMAEIGEAYRAGLEHFGRSLS